MTMICDVDNDIQDSNELQAIINFLSLCRGLYLNVRTQVLTTSTKTKSISFGRELKSMCVA